MSRALVRAAAALTAALLATGGAGASAAGPQAGWSQWGRDSRHDGLVAGSGQALERVVARFVVDPFVEDEKIDGFGGLQVHYQVPLLRGADVFTMVKTGTYTPDDLLNTATHWNTQVWNESRLTLRDGRLVTRWRFASDWKPEPADLLLGWEPVFQPALAGDDLYVPGLGGTILRLDPETGRVRARIDPFGAAVDPSVYVAGPLTAAPDGTVYYDAVRLNPDETASDGWLVRVSRDGRTRTARFADLVPQGPTRCEGTFALSELPWPPSPSARPASAPCGAQRPGINVAPAVAPDGTVYTVSRADGSARDGFLVAVGPDLTPRWAASLRGRLGDGCGVLVPIAATSAPEQGACRTGAPRGVDPATNGPPAGEVSDLSTSSPTVMPDGGVLYGAYTRYDGARGHLFEFGPAGELRATYDAGWDVTPAVYQRDGVHVVIKENHYDGELGRYCDPLPDVPVSRIVCGHVGVPSGPFFVTQLDAGLRPEWRFQSSGAEWCVNAPAVDARGTVYAANEDGHLYGIPQGHRGDFTGPAQRLFTGVAEGAAYTPLSISARGLVLTQNDGTLLVTGARPPAGSRTP